MDIRKRTALVLSALLFGMGGSTAFAEAQYTARDKNGQIVKQGMTMENEEFSAFDGLEYEINGEHRTNKGENSAAYVFGNGAKVHINGNIVNRKDGTSIEVEDQTSAVIYGNLYGDVRNFDSTLEIHGDVEVESEAWLGAIFAFGEVGNKIGHKTQTTVLGNIKSKMTGVLALDGGHVKIVGNIEAGADGVDVGDLYDSDGVDGAAVEVQGNVIGHENGIIVDQSNPEIFEGSQNRWNDTFCVKVQGNVFTDGMDGIDTNGMVIVEGDVTGRMGGVSLGNNGDVTVTGDVIATMKEIDDLDEDYYNQYGEWRVYYGDAIQSFLWDRDIDHPKSRKIRVAGNARATGNGIAAEYGDIVVEGNVISEYESCINVLDFLPVSVDVGGNVEGNARKSAVSLAANDENKIIIRGKVNARGKQSAIEIYDEGTTGTTRTNAQKNLPMILVKTLNVESGDYFKALTHDENGEEIESKALAEAAAKATWYIVDICQPTNGEIEVDGISAKEGLLVAHEGDKLTVTGAPKKGYCLTGIDAGSKALVTENEDGTYTVTVERGGDVTISASFEAMPEMPLTGDQIPIKTAIFLAVVSITLLGMLWKTKRA